MSAFLIGYHMMAYFEAADQELQVAVISDNLPGIPGKLAAERTRNAAIKAPGIL